MYTIQQSESRSQKSQSEQSVRSRCNIAINNENNASFMIVIILSLRSLLVVAGGTGIGVALFACVILTVSTLSQPQRISTTETTSDSKCRAVLIAGTGVLSSAALTSFTLRNIPQFAMKSSSNEANMNYSNGEHLTALFHIAFTLSRFIGAALSLRVTPSSIWLYSALFTIFSLLLLPLNAHCGTTLGVLAFGCFVGVLHPSALSSLTDSGQMSLIHIVFLVLLAEVAESIRLLHTDSVYLIFMLFSLLSLVSAVLKRLNANCTWEPDMPVRMVP